MPGRTRTALSIAAAALVGAALGVGALVATRDGASAGPPAPVVAAAAPAVESAAPAPPQPPQIPQPPPPPRDDVPPAAPTAFRIAGPAFDIQAQVCGMPYVRPLNPPGDQYRTVCWVEEDFGVPPGSSSGGTTYVLGHSWAQAPLVLNPLSEHAMREFTGANPQYEGAVPIYPIAALDGYQLTLGTPNGTLGYTVTRSYAVAKSLAGDVASLMANSPDRVVIITCAVKDGADLDYNVIVEAHIASSAAAAPSAAA